MLNRTMPKGEDRDEDRPVQTTPAGHEISVDEQGQRREGGDAGSPHTPLAHARIGVLHPPVLIGSTRWRVDRKAVVVNTARGASGSNGRDCSS